MINVASEDSSVLSTSSNTQKKGIDGMMNVIFVAFATLAGIPAASTLAKDKLRENV